MVPDPTCEPVDLSKVPDPNLCDPTCEPVEVPAACINEEMRIIIKGSRLA